LGNCVIPFQFVEARVFSEGLAAVTTQAGDGYIDKTGKFVIKPQFGGAFEFSNGIAKVFFRDGPFLTPPKWSWINTNGVPLWRQAEK
jgi:flagellar hook protein FlgE